MDPPEKILLEFDTSLAIMMEAMGRSHRVFYTEPHELSLANGALNGMAREVESAGRESGFRFKAARLSSISEFDAVLIRKDPPVDIHYFNMLYLLDYAVKKTLVINSPSGIRQANEKLFPFYFKDLMPPSVATSQESEILKFQEHVNSDVILKPLNRKGGEGILLLKKSASAKSKSEKIKKVTRGGLETILAQKFIKAGITEGDRRILLWDGEILGAFGRVPKFGEYRSNLSLGGSMKKIEATKQEQRMVQKLRPTLKKLGLIFVGIDMIDGWMTEINVTSPAGITEIDELYNAHVESRVLDSLEKWM